MSKSDGCDTVVAAIVGAAGMAPSLAAARAGKRILLANKEALVMSGAIFMDAVRDHGAILLPVDSEHNAIFQCMPRDAAEHGGISKIILTASGGPFRTREPATLVDVTPEEACKHPNWVMGRKISVDSATMMNKGLEVIEAHWIFGLPGERIDVLIHPQSVIHSLVSYRDGSVLAQLGNPTCARRSRTHSRSPSVSMRASNNSISRKLPSCRSRSPITRASVLALALKALEEGGIASAALNAANEVAVEAPSAASASWRLRRRSTLCSTRCRTVRPTAEDVLAADAEARRLAAEIIAKAPAPRVERTV